MATTPTPKPDPSSLRSATFAHTGPERVVEAITRRLTEAGGPVSEDSLVTEFAPKVHYTDAARAWMDRWRYQLPRAVERDPDLADVHPERAFSVGKGRPAWESQSVRYDDGARIVVVTHILGRRAAFERVTATGQPYPDARGHKRGPVYWRLAAPRARRPRRPRSAPSPEPAAGVVPAGPPERGGLLATVVAPLVPASGDVPTSRVPESAVLHRHDWWAYILNDPSVEPWHREHLGALRRVWEEANAAHFGGALVPPYVLLAEPSEPKQYGDCGRVSGFGGRSQIRLRPSLLAGTHPHVRSGDEYAEGRSRVVADVLLHEMVHQWQQEAVGDQEDAYHGHGPRFRDRANAIGAALGLAPVRTMKRRGPDKDRPSCSQWPHNVRPRDYYLGAYAPSPAAPAPAPPRAPKPVEAAPAAPDDVARVADELRRRFTPAELRALMSRLAGTLHLDPPILRAIEDERRPLRGPRELLPRDGQEYAHHTIEHLRLQWVGVRADGRYLLRVLEEVRAARIWEHYPPDQPYGSLDALCRAELGASERDLMTVPTSRDAREEAAG